MERKSIGSFIAALRRANGMTQKELAERLSVSDKAVSRWERDDSLPDVMLLPVIADLFHITVDELLRGERREEPLAQSGQAMPNTAAETVRLKKQTKRVLAVQLARLRNRSCIALGIGATGLIAALVCNFGLSRGFVAFCVGSICIIIASIMAALFCQNSWQAADDEDFDADSVFAYRKNVIQYAKGLALLLLFMLCLCLPMALSAVGNVYGYADVFINADVWLKSSALCLAVLLSIFSLIIWRINCHLRETQYAVNPSDVALHGWCVGILCGLMILTVLCRLLLTPVSTRVYQLGEVYDNVEQFKAEMERRFQEEKDKGTWENVSFWDENGNELSAEEGTTRKLYAHDGSILCEYHKPESVMGVKHTYYGDDGYRIYVYDESDYRTAEMLLKNEKYLVDFILMTEPLLMLGIYMLLRNEKKRKA